MEALLEPSFKTGKLLDWVNGLLNYFQLKDKYLKQISLFCCCSGFQLSTGSLNWGVFVTLAIFRGESSPTCSKQFCYFYFLFLGEISPAPSHFSFGLNELSFSSCLGFGSGK